jgi:hypothetical protein
MEFNITVGAREWDAIRAGWTSGALRLPGAQVVAVYADGRLASADEFTRDGDIVRWRAQPGPAEASITLRLEKALETEDARLALERDKFRSERIFKVLGTAGAVIVFIAGGQIPALQLIKHPAPGHEVVQAAFNQGARELESRLDETRGKLTHRASLTVGAPLAQLKRAVFQSMVSLNASAEVLQGALQVLTTRRPEIADYSDAVVRSFPSLMRLRRNWLHDAALPAYNAALAAMNPVQQDTPRADVSLPSELDILSGVHGQETVSDGAALQDELQLLDERLAETSTAPDANRR